MGYIVLSLIIVFLILAIIHRNIATTMKYLLILLFVLIIMYPEDSIKSAKDGINLWIFVLAPSLLPFFIVNDILVSSGIPENISKLFSRYTNFLFKTSGYGAYVFIMSIFTGYPSGAKLVSELIKDNKITPEEGEMILNFSSTSGPLFIIGTVGSGMLKSSYIGYILYISHIIGAIVNGIFYRFVYKNRTYANSKPILKSYSKKPMGEMFTKAISSSFITMGFIGGYVIIFSVILCLLNKTGFFTIITIILTKICRISIRNSYVISNLLQSFLEITNGSNIISISQMDTTSKILIISFLIGFSGLSIIGQAASILSSTKVSISKYIISKITHGLFSVVITYIVLKIAKVSTETAAIDLRSTYFNLSIYEILIVLLSLLFILNIIYIKKIKRARSC